MKVKMILPALTEAKSPFWRPIKYSLFPPLGLATLAGYLDPDDEVTIQDEHVETLDLDDEPDLVVIQVYITSAYRAYAAWPTTTGARARTSAWAGCTSPRCRRKPPPRRHHLPRPGRGYLAGLPGRLARRARRERSTVSTSARWWALPPIRRDLIKRHLYLVPNSIVVSRGCPHACDFLLQGGLLPGRQVLLHPGRR